MLGKFTKKLRKKSQNYPELISISQENIDDFKNKSTAVE